MKKITFSPHFLDLLVSLILLNLIGGITSITTTETTTASTTTSDPTITSYSTPDTTKTSTSIPIIISTSDSDPTTTSSTTSDPITIPSSTLDPTTTSSATSDPKTTSSATSDPTTTSSATSDSSTTSSATSDPSTIQTSSTSDATTTSSITSDMTITSFSTSDPTTTSTTMSDQITTSTTTSDTPTTSASMSDPTTTSTSTSDPTTSTSTSDSTTTPTSTTDTTTISSSTSDPTTTTTTMSDTTTTSTSTSDPTSTSSTTSDPTTTSSTTSDSTTSSTTTSDTTTTSTSTSDPTTTSSTTSDPMTTSSTSSDSITISSTTSTLSDQTTASSTTLEKTTTSTSTSDQTTTSFTTLDPTTTSSTKSDPTTTSSATSDSTTTSSATSDPTTTSSATSDSTTTFSTTSDPTTTFSTTSDPMTTFSTTSDPTTTSSTKSDSTTTSVTTPVTTIILISTSDSTTSSFTTSDPTTTSSTTSDTTTIFTTMSDPQTASSTTSDPTATSSSTSDSTASSSTTSDPTTTSSTSSGTTTIFTSTSDTKSTSISTSDSTTTSSTTSDTTTTPSTSSDTSPTSSSTSNPTTTFSTMSDPTSTSSTTSDPTTTSSSTSVPTKMSFSTSDTTTTSSSTSDPTTASSTTSISTATSSSTSDSTTSSSTTSDQTTTSSTTSDTTTIFTTTSDPTTASSSTSDTTSTSTSTSDSTTTSSTTSDTTPTSSSKSSPTTTSSTTSDPTTTSSSTSDTTTTSTSTSDPTTTSSTTSNPRTTSTTTSDTTSISSSTSDPTTISFSTSDPTKIFSSTLDPTTTSTTTSDPTATSSTTDFTTFAFSTTDQTNYDPGTVSVVVSQFYRNNQHVIAFRCDFTTADNALYDVEWYVSGSVFTSQVGMSASAAASYEVATDTFSDITSNLFSFEVEFYCTVTVSTGSGSPAWSTVQSPSFKTFEVSETSMTFSRGEEKSFTVTMNIPFGCSPGQLACSLQFKFYDPDDGYYGFDSSIAIRSSTGGIPTISGITQGSTDLTVTSTVLNIMISAIHNSRYRLRSSFSLRMKTSVVWGAHSMWTTEFSTTFLITVTDSGSLRWRVCYAFVDPHMRTFDGIRYENQNEGEFVLFRSTLRPIEIQMVTKTCGWRWSTAFCPCALTFRAGGDVFTIDHCSGHTTGFLSSRDGILTVYRMYSTSYLIYFPTGLKVYVFLMPHFYYFMNIMIYPTPYEIGKAEGLCGNFNNDRLIDNAYSDESLRLSSTYENVATWDTSLTKCIFPYERYGQSGSAICSINENNLRSYFYYGYFIISSRYRGKRDTSKGYYEKREPKFWPSAERSERKRRSSVSLEDAWQICHDELAVNCSAYALRDNVTDLADVNQTLNNCALDVMLDGSSSWVEPHCDSFTQTLVITVEQDTEFSENNTDLAATIESQKCPNNCNGHGSCVNGSCVCDTGYGTDLCLININEPPTIENILDGDYCDLLGGQSCESILLVSNGFLENVTCGVVIYQVFLEKKISPYPTVWIQDQTACSVQSDLDLHCLQKVSESCLAAKRLIQIIQRTSFTVACEYENFNEAYAPTSSSQTATDSFGQRIGLTASNNGVNFSDSKYVVVLDSTCQEIGNESNGDTILLLKSGYCYIDGVCYASGSVNPSRTCELCMPDEDLFNWYSLCKPESSTDKEITSVITIVAPLAGTLLGVLLALVVVRLCCVTKQRPRIGQAQETVEEIPSETSYANATTLYELDEAVPVTSVMERPMKTQLNYSNMHLDQSKNTKFQPRTVETSWEDF